MKELISNFGIDPKLLFAQAFNFALVFFVLQRFVFSKLILHLSERKQKIEKGLEMHEKAGQELSRARVLGQEEVEAGKQEASKLLSKAHAAVTEKLQNAESSIQEKSQRMLSAAKENGEKARREIIEGAKGEMTEIALLAIERMWKKNAAKELEQKLAKEVAAVASEYSYEK